MGRRAVSRKVTTETRRLWLDLTAEPWRKGQFADADPALAPLLAGFTELSGPSWAISLDAIDRR